MMFSPTGVRNYTSLRYTAKDCKKDWCGGDLKEWPEWLKAGWRVYPVTVNIEILSTFISLQAMYKRYKKSIMKKK